MAETEVSAAKRVAALRTEIEEHNRRYYEEAAPTISDREYDRLYRDLLDLEDRFPQLTTPESPTRRVGGGPLKAFSQITHRVAMLSLDNTYSEEEVAAFYRRIEKLLHNPQIVRNRLKVDSTVSNAAAFLAVQREFGSFDRFIWASVASAPRINRWRRIGDVPASTPESDALSKTLKQRGFRFVGTTICYAFMQATGLVNDHLVDCFRYSRRSP